MKVIISSTYDDQYLFFLPIVNWCWNKLDVDVICFMPSLASNTNYSIYEQWLGRSTLVQTTAKSCQFEYFTCQDHKQSTYAQCSRLFASSLDYLNPTEYLTVSDADMALFKLPPTDYEHFCIFGADLVPENQFPMCYITSTTSSWRYAFRTWGSGYQHKLDKLVGSIECTDFRGNQWSLDQSEAFCKIMPEKPTLLNRASPGTQFATNRIDRDDTNWRSHLGIDLFDAHLWRPGYDDMNFANILELLSFQYPEENFQWLIDYRNYYIKLLWV